ncbi:MAG: LEPR-XLL domain-containing protein, partial [Verrucomicrobiota bacterium]
MSRRFSVEALESRILLAGDGLLDPLAPSRPDPTGSGAIDVASLGTDPVAPGTALDTSVDARNPLDGLFEGVAEDWSRVASETPSETPPSGSVVAGGAGRVRPAGDSDPVTPTVFEIDGVLRLTVNG